MDVEYNIVSAATKPQLEKFVAKKFLSPTQEDHEQFSCDKFSQATVCSLHIPYHIVSLINYKCFIYIVVMVTGIQAAYSIRSHRSGEQIIGIYSIQ